MDSLLVDTRFGHQVLPTDDEIAQDSAQRSSLLPSNEHCDGRQPQALFVEDPTWPKRNHRDSTSWRLEVPQASSKADAVRRLDKLPPRYLRQNLRAQPTATVNSNHHPIARPKQDRQHQERADTIVIIAAVLVLPNPNQAGPPPPANVQQSPRWLPRDH